MTTYGAINDDKFTKLTIFCFQFASPDQTHLLFTELHLSFINNVFVVKFKSMIFLFRVVTSDHTVLQLNWWNNTASLTFEYCIETRLMSKNAGHVEYFIRFHMKYSCTVINKNSGTLHITMIINVLCTRVYRQQRWNILLILACIPIILVGHES